MTMKKVLIAFLVVVLFATSAVSVSAKPDKSARPEKLDKVIFVHPVAPGKPGKPDNPPGKPPKEEEEPKDDTDYELWGGYLIDTVSYYINPDVSLVTGGDPIAAVNDGVEAWDAATADELFSYLGPTEKRWYEEDGQNTVSWVKFTPRDYIAVAVMWYDPDTMIIWEVDIIFNTFQRWGIDPAKKDRAFDIQNIATHEFGHPTGLDDLYGEIYGELTMYGYSSKGETEKRSLEDGDIAGARFLYGTP
jgi:fermentation-respiration switch protein FrsA (DUF1100 family)